MKIILARPNYKSHIITPPLGIGYLSSYLKRDGVEVMILDGLRDGLDNGQMLRLIRKERPDAVGISCLTAFYKETVDLAAMLKDEGIRFVIGGVHPTFLPYSTLSDTGADFVICGEGEIALRNLINCGFQNKNIKGVYSIKDLGSDNDPIEKAEIIGNLDEIPFPDWEQIPPNSYPCAPHGAIVKNVPIGSIVTSRGCPYECTFCASPRLCDRKIRFRSPVNVVEEIKYLTDRFGVREIHFEDDNLTYKREHVEQICDLIIQNKLKISWACPNGIRADKVDEALIRLMAESGCYYFAYGIESANPYILKNIKKHEDIKTIERSIDLANKYGISCQGFFIFGLPGETTGTIKETIDFARRSKLSRAQFLLLDIIPGSQLWYDLKGKFIPNWGKDSFKESEWVPEGLTAAQLSRAQARAFRSFYFRLFIFFKLVSLIKLSQLKFLIRRLKEYRIFKTNS